jgi:hypothetical protein
MSLVLQPGMLTLVEGSVGAGGESKAATVDHGRLCGLTMTQRWLPDTG